MWWRLRRCRAGTGDAWDGPCVMQVPPTTSMYSCGRVGGWGLVGWVMGDIDGGGRSVCMYAQTYISMAMRDIKFAIS